MVRPIYRLGSADPITFVPDHVTSIKLTNEEKTILLKLREPAGVAEFDSKKYERLVREKLVRQKEDGLWQCSDRGSLCLANAGLLHTG